MHMRALENWDHELHPLQRAVASNNVGVVRLLLAAAAGVSPNPQLATSKTGD